MYCSDKKDIWLQGAKTSGRIPREAMLKLSITLSTALSSESTTSELYKDANDAAAGAIDLAGAAASAVTEQYQSAIRLQNMTGQVTTLSKGNLYQLFQLNSTEKMALVQENLPCMDACLCAFS